MRKFVVASASIAAFALIAGASLADTIVVEPEVDTWIMEQPGPVATYDQDVVVGGVLPDTVEVVEVPKYQKYGYVMLNKKRVLIDRSNRKIIKVY
jgi:hypothetical protein